MSEIRIQELFEALNQVAKQNLLTKEETKEIIEQAVFKSFHSKFDPDADLELIIDEDKNIFQLVNKSTLVVSDTEFQDAYAAIEIPLSLAKKLKKDVQEGDVIANEIDFATYAKQFSQQIRQMITQSVREKRKLVVFEKHQALKGEMIEVTVTQVTDSYVIFALDDGTTAFMPAKLRNMLIPLSIGQRVKVYVEDVLRESKDAQIVVSNGSPILLRRVFELEVPEIADGSIEIVNISRIAGERAKVAVKSNKEGVDPIGSIIGASGARINAIVNKLNGEKIDVILYSPDINTFIANALAPSKIISVIDKLDENNEPIKGYKIAIAPNKHHTLAIGRGGSNARLAVELVNSRIDIISHDDAQKQGIEIIWNGNINQSELAQIEAGQKPTFNRPGGANRSNGRNANNNINNISTSIFDDDITSFNEEIEFTKDQDTAFEIDDEVFSAEELKAMQSSFEFDDELLNSLDDEFDSADEGDEE